VTSAQEYVAEKPDGSVWQRAAARALRVLRRLVHGFFAHNCLTGASALSYSTILSFLPLTALVLVVFSSFPVLAEAKNRFLSVLLANFAPQIGDSAIQWFEFAAGNAAKTTAIGAIAFIFTSIMLLATIEDQLDTIWEVETPRSWGQRITAYWLVLTLGPLLLGGALTLSTYVADFVGAGGPHGTAQPALDWLGPLTRFVPVILEFVSLGFLYSVIPNTHVRWRDAIAGAVAAALALEALKWAFGFYILQISSYNLIYGAVAGVPIFLLWMYVFWLVVLLGAELAAALSPRWSADHAPHAPTLAIQAELGMGLLMALASNMERGGSVALYELSARLGTNPALAREHLVRLQEAGLVAATGEGGWVLTRSLDTLNLGDLYEALKIRRPAGQSNPS
jgi:membrane protein